MKPIGYIAFFTLGAYIFAKGFLYAWSVSHWLAIGLMFLPPAYGVLGIYALFI